MKRDPIFKHVATVFVGALVMYGVSFTMIERFRNVKGPWEVTFRTDTNGQPSISISQKTFAIANMSLVFLGEHAELANGPVTMVFDSPKTNAPFGKIVFLDTTVLPGTVTLELFGHEIELLPRVMILNRKEVPWKSEASISLQPVKR